MEKYKKIYTRPTLTEWRLFTEGNMLFNPNPTSSSLPSNPDTPGVGVKEWDVNEDIWGTEFGE